MFLKLLSNCKTQPPVSFKASHHQVSYLLTKAIPEWYRPCDIPKPNLEHSLKASFLGSNQNNYFSWNLGNAFSYIFDAVLYHKKLLDCVHYKTAVSEKLSNSLKKWKLQKVSVHVVLNFRQKAHVPAMWVWLKIKVCYCASVQAKN